MPVTNLEPLCARYGNRIVIDPRAEDRENTITRALGVLTENGLYALALYLLTCKKKEYGKRILTVHLRGLWQEEDIKLIGSGVAASDTAVLQALEDLSSNLGLLIMAKRLTEQTLTFARYHAKALAVDGGAGGTQQ